MPIQTLLNSRKGAVLEAEQALNAACAALAEHGDLDELSSALQQSEQALRVAGWQHALCFNQALLMAAPFIADNDARRTSFEAALSDFTAALCRRNLRELASSTQLIEHYRTLCASANPERSSIISFDEFALAKRLVPQALLCTELSAHEITRLRERYEHALLIVLRTSAQQASSAPLLAEDALDELDACLAALAHSSPYNLWYLASACVRAQREAGVAYDDDAKRLYASYNLLLSSQMSQIEANNGMTCAPHSVVRTSVALLWRAFAIEGAAPKSGEYVQLLRDYGLSVAWRLIDLNPEQASDYAEGAQLLYDTDSSEDQQIGALTLNGSAHENFLVMADLSIATLTKYTDVVAASDKPQAGLALQASEAAYCLANLACQIGLAKLAWLADMLGLAWRRYAYLAAQSIETRENLHDLSDGAMPADRPNMQIFPFPAILQEGGKKLEENLQQFAAGRLADEASADDWYWAELSAFIESANES